MAFDAKAVLTVINMNSFLGLLYHWIGGLSSASFYIPYRGVKKWSWETYWLVGGFFSWIIAPVLFASTMTNDLPGVLSETPVSTLFFTYLFGALWGVGGLTFGLTMRYLGISLGMAVALGFCAAFGTLMPPIFNALFVAGSPTLAEAFGTTSGIVILIGVAVCLIGIGISGLAGKTKENEMNEEQKKAIIKEFNFRKGILVATFSGIMSACFSYGLAAGEPIKKLTLQHGTGELWQGLPVLVVVLLGGFTTNFIWCLILNVRNGSGGQYFSSQAKEPGSAVHPIIETVTDAPAEEMARQAPFGSNDSSRVPLVFNYLFCALAGTLWYFQFFFYTMGESKLGELHKFSNWPLHMASIIIFSSLWGLALKEWRGASSRAMIFLALSLFVLVGSTVIIGYGNSLAVPISGH
jgi:L-rhamnose-H+ transport protein